MKKDLKPRRTEAGKISKPSSSKPTGFSRKLAMLVIFLLAVMLYANTIGNDYALDDRFAVTGNQFVQKGFSGLGKIFTTNFFAGSFGETNIELAGGRYRPLSLAIFAIEHQFFGQNPHFSHFLNAVLYGITGLLLFMILFMLIPPSGKVPLYFSVPFLAVLIFIAHPVHTEVVANIKGRDELLCFAGVLLSCWLYLKYLQAPRTMLLIINFFVFLLAMLSKENAVTFVAVLPLSAWFFSRASIKRMFTGLIPVILAVLSFLVIRQMVLGGQNPVPSKELMDNPFLEASQSQKYGTILYTFGIYLKLLFIPHPLTWDYYPYHLPLVSLVDIRSLLPLSIYAGLAAIALWKIRQKSIISFGILFYFITISVASNIFFPIGAFMAERFIFIPSLGFTLVLAYFLSEKIPATIRNPQPYFSKVLPVVLVLIISLYSIKTIARNKVWKDDFTLYSTDVITSTNSAKGNNIAGQYYAYESRNTNDPGLKEKYIRLSIIHLKKAVDIHPKFWNAWFYLGNVYYDYRKDTDSTFYCYKKILAMRPDEEEVFKNTGLILGGISDNNYKIKIYSELLDVCPNRYSLNYDIAGIYGSLKGKTDSAIYYMERAARIDSSKADPFRFLGTAWYIKNEYASAVINLEKALKLNPSDTSTIRTLGYSYLMEGRKDKAEACFRKLKPM